jgi:hypothetical protein
MQKRIYSYLLLSSIALFFWFCGDRKNDPEPGKTLQVTVNVLMNNAPISFNDFRYTNAVGDSFDIRKLSFFLSNFELRNSETGEVYKELASYHLINAADAKALQFNLSRIPSGVYDQLTFALGVDSAANLSLNQVGDLTPSSDMAWDWETGYKFLLLEGNYKSVGGKRGGLVFHIGENPAYTKFTYSLANGTFQPLNFKDKQPQLSLTANVDELFRNPNTISFDSLNATMSLSAGGDLIVQNYAQGFISAMVINK